MPNTVQRSERDYIEFACCMLLLFFFIPIKIGNYEAEEEIRFQKYLQDFNKSFENSTIYWQKFRAFKRALKTIELLNIEKDNGAAQYGLTKFSDMLPEEFLKSNLLPDLSMQLKRILLLANSKPDISEDNNSIEEIRQSIRTLNIPQKIDWREKNTVTKIQNQRLCSACWAFAAIGIIESMNAIKTGKLENLSIQEMIDCSMYNAGCDGGNICALLRWMKSNRIKVVHETDYPLTLHTGHCKNTSLNGVQIRDYSCNNLVGSEEKILTFLANHGPVAVAINALSWQNYIGGTIQFNCDGNPFKLNHAVQIVGYDLTSDVPYYIVRNSWGEDFGDNGYLYIAVGKNMCGLAHEVSVVTL